MVNLRSQETQVMEILVLVREAGRERTSFRTAGEHQAHCQAIPPIRMETRANQSRWKYPVLLHSLHLYGLPPYRESGAGARVVPNLTSITLSLTIIIP